MGDPFIHLVGPRKVRITRAGVSLFNSRWPGSKLDPKRAYWFEFDAEGNLVDHDVPEHSDGTESLALSNDAQAWLEADTWPEWHPDAAEDN
jgi:hypothetical protein